MRIIFLDIDGVLNCQIFYEKRFKDLTLISKQPLYKQAKNLLRKMVKGKKISKMDYYKSQLCSERMQWLNELVQSIDAKVVISSTWRLGKSIEELQQILDYAGATFTVIDKTPDLKTVLRGNEIHQWIEDNSEKVLGIPYYEYKNYVIIDDDSDMLLWQKDHFFQTDPYSGLTPTTCYKIRRFFGCKMFDC